MKVLTVRQPWASLIIGGHKDIENRSWTTHYRGPLAIHAGQATDQGGLRACRELLPEVLPHGSVLGIVDLVDVVTDSRSRWAEPGLYHWVLKNPRTLGKPIPVAGKLGLWTPSPSLAMSLDQEDVTPH